MTEIKKEVKEMLENFGFKTAELKSDLTDYKTHIATYVVRIKANADREYYLNFSVFQDGYYFSIMDKIGIIKLISFKENTPTYVLSKYIERTAEFFSL